jgi:CRISPR system Cascade subunit CasA
VVVMALARGQGKTEGYHERRIPIPPKTRRLLAQAEGQERLGVRSKLQIERAGEAGRVVLKPALCTLLQGTGDLDFRDRRVDPWIARLDTRIDDRFFTELFDAAPLDADAARVRWDRILVALLRQTFEEALGEAPMASAHRHRTTAAAEGRFGAALRKIFPEAIAPRTTTTEQAHA